MTTKTVLPYHSIVAQVAAAQAGEYAGETEQDRHLRYAGVAAVGRGVLAQFAAQLGGVSEKEALNELLGCLMVRSWELDEEAHEARAAGSPRTQPVFERALSTTAFRLELAGRVDESRPDDEEGSTPGNSL